MIISNNLSKLSNDQLYIQYQTVRQQLLEIETGSPEEKELDLLYTELSKEIANRKDFDLSQYKLSEQTNNK